MSHQSSFFFILFKGGPPMSQRGPGHMAPEMMSSTQMQQTNPNIQQGPPMGPTGSSGHLPPNQMSSGPQMMPQTGQMPPSGPQSGPGHMMPVTEPSQMPSGPPPMPGNGSNQMGPGMNQMGQGPMGQGPPANQQMGHMGPAPSGHMNATMPGHMPPGPPGPPMGQMSGPMPPTGTGHMPGNNTQATSGPSPMSPNNTSAPPSGPTSGPNSGQENLNALQKAIDSMEEKGLQEDPRYSQLLALRARQGSGMGDKQTFSSSQLQQLRVQIMAYRLLARNQPLSQQLALAVQGEDFC